MPEVFSENSLFVRKVLSVAEFCLRGSFHPPEVSRRRSFADTKIFTHESLWEKLVGHEEKLNSGRKLARTKVCWRKIYSLDKVFHRRWEDGKVSRQRREGETVRSGR